MPSLAVLRTLLREITASERVERTPEPDLVMDDPAKVAAYVKAGRANGVMAPVYLHHCAHVCEVTRPGDTVVDLACGPANQLAMIAELNPHMRFIGVDLSQPMLARARDNVREKGLTNVELQYGDISQLSDIADASVDAVVSTMALHHLPTFDHLQRTLTEVARILKPGGGVFLVDFGRLKAERSMRYFAYQYADQQPELFTLDYWYSLHAAFAVEDFRRAGAALAGAARLYTTFLSPYMVAFKSGVRREADPALRERFQSMRGALPHHHQVDLRDLTTFFGLSGLRSRLLS